MRPRRLSFPAGTHPGGPVAGEPYAKRTSRRGRSARMTGFAGGFSGRAKGKGPLRFSRSALGREAERALDMLRMEVVGHIAPRS